MTYTLLMGTRPEIIKMAPVIKEMKKKMVMFQAVYFTQHYTPSMYEPFLEDLGIKSLVKVLHWEPKNQLSTITMCMDRLNEITGVLDHIIVQGDTNTALAGALFANKTGKKLSHVEAGLRSFDRTMPEEVNRVLIDNMCDMAFCPTHRDVQNLNNEKIQCGKRVTGNTIIDALKMMKITGTAIDDRDGILVTLHRPENVDEPEMLDRILRKINALCDYLETTAILPVHPRTKKNIKDKYNNIVFEEPMGYRQFLELLSHKRLCITDSGGVQEECNYMRTPVCVVRKNTERMLSLKPGYSELCGIEGIVQIGRNIYDNIKQHPHEDNTVYGIGNAARIIVETLEASK